MSTDDTAVLIDCLSEHGHRWVEIERVLAKLDEHDKRMIHEFVFDSIERGTFNIRSAEREGENEL